jgi:hypothetical protein
MLGEFTDHGWMSAILCRKARGQKFQRRPALTISSSAPDPLNAPAHALSAHFRLRRSTISFVTAKQLADERPKNEVTRFSSLIFNSPSDPKIQLGSRREQRHNHKTPLLMDDPVEFFKVEHRLGMARLIPFARAGAATCTRRR